MGFYKYISKLHRERPEEYLELSRQRLIQWRRESAKQRIQYPTDIVSARRLGYKPKHGFILVRIRLNRGQKKRPTINKGRRSAHMGQRLVLAKNYRWVAEERASKYYPNLEVLNSYKVGKDGLHYWYEVILVDPNHPEIKADKNISWISSKKHTGRVYRGLTSAARKSRGLRNRGKGSEKVRPSRTANIERRKD